MLRMRIAIIWLLLYYTATRNRKSLLLICSKPFSRASGLYKCESQRIYYCKISDFHVFVEKCYYIYYIENPGILRGSIYICVVGQNEIFLVRWASYLKVIYYNYAQTIVYEIPLTR